MKSIILVSTLVFFVVPGFTQIPKNSKILHVSTGVSIAPSLQLFNEGNSMRILNRRQKRFISPGFGFEFRHKFNSALFITSNTDLIYKGRQDIFISDGSGFSKLKEGLFFLQSSLRIGKVLGKRENFLPSIGVFYGLPEFGFNLLGALAFRGLKEYSGNDFGISINSTIKKSKYFYGIEFEKGFNNLSEYKSSKFYSSRIALKIGSILKVKPPAR